MFKKYYESKAQFYINEIEKFNKERLEKLDNFIDAVKKYKDFKELYFKAAKYIKKIPNGSVCSEKAVNYQIEKNLTELYNDSVIHALEKDTEMNALSELRKLQSNLNASIGYGFDNYIKEYLEKLNPVINNYSVAFKDYNSKNKPNKDFKSTEILEYEDIYRLPNVKLESSTFGNQKISTINKLINLRSLSPTVNIYFQKDSKEIIVENIFDLPNLLIGGTVMSGKSAFVHSIIDIAILQNMPNDLKLLIYDSKQIEYNEYRNLPHLLCPIANTEKDIEVCLRIIRTEIERRYLYFDANNTKCIQEYNGKKYRSKEFPLILIVLDDFTTIGKNKDIRESIDYITLHGWEVGVSLIVVANHPTSEVLSTLSKANFPSRLCFNVVSSRDSMTILDSSGAENIKEQGMCMYRSSNYPEATYYKTLYISESDRNKILEEWYKRYNSLERSHVSKETKTVTSESSDPLYDEIVEFVIKTGKVSTSLLQRKYKLGYNRAARIIDILEEKGIVGPQIGSKPREVLVKLEK